MDQIRVLAIIIISVSLFSCKVSQRESDGNTSHFTIDSNQSISLTDKKDGICVIPDSVRSGIASWIDTSSFIIANWVTPCYLSLDFDKDGKNEYAIAIVEISSNRRGIAVRGPNQKILILGAGAEFKKSGRDLKWVDAWGVNDDRKVSKSIISPDFEIIGTEDYFLDGESLLLTQEEGVRVYLGWNDKNFEWLVLE
ncbi:hypothetical protein [Pontibacter sp. G13]|uniref:hypothetical protein n=1 Tax=Pontibacter sp. G13 TaxID=3074898 RepID=UPI00288A4048|nr:hypothetical protein [Pontibacter sp. G13]WNJ19614.1 hypothetical protein RJD25_03925 [Pontibacter sp. G13]